MNVACFLPDVFKRWAVEVLEHNDDNNDDDDGDGDGDGDDDVAGVLLCAMQVMSLVLT